MKSRSQWPRGLRRRSAAARLLRSWVRIPPGAWIFVCCECSVLSGRGLCDKPFTRSEETYRLWCVVVCDLDTSRMWSYILYSSNTWEKMEHNEAVHQLFIDFKKAYDSVRRETLYNILIEFGIPKKLVRLIQMCLTETYSRVRVGNSR
jgi:hypothetical protein